MTITFTTPANLIGQPAANFFDPGRAGVARGSQPAGALGSTITLPAAYATQAYEAGFTFSSWAAG